MSLADVTSNLRAPIVTKVADKPTVRVHSVEWRKIMAGEPVEINPSVSRGLTSSLVWAQQGIKRELQEDRGLCNGRA